MSRDAALSHLRRLPRVMAVAALAIPVVTVSFAAVPAVATGGPNVQVSPSTGLTNRQNVTVTYSGYGPDVYDVTIRQCIQNPTNADSDCTAANGDLNSPDASGSGSGVVEVYSGNDRALVSAVGNIHLTCDNTHPCELGAFPNFGDLSTATLVPVTFAPTPPPVPPGASISPATDITDGQYVTVSYQGLPAEANIGFRECVAKPVNIQTDCTGLFPRISFAGKDGAGSVQEPIHAGQGNLLLSEADGVKTLSCDATNPCVLALFPLDYFNLGPALLIPLNFSGGLEACPPPNGNSLLGSGAQSANRAMLRWEVATCNAPHNVSLDYLNTFSAKGATDLEKGVVDFGVTGQFLPADAPTGPAKFQYAPLTASALVIAYRMYDRVTGQQITNLTLTPAMIARIFTGRQQEMDQDPANNNDIAALNPGINLPNKQPQAYVRAEGGAAQTVVFTSWLAATAPTAFPSKPTNEFPGQLTNPVGVSGVDALGLKVVGERPDGAQTVAFDQGFNTFGVMDMATALHLALPVVQIKRADGSIARPTTDAVRHALATAPVNPDGTLAFNYGTTDSLSYPMPILTYLMAPTAGLDPAKGAQLASFLRYAMGPGQDNLPSGFAPLPNSLTAASLHIADLIPGGVAATAGSGSSSPFGGSGLNFGNSSGAGAADGSGLPSSSSTSGAAGSAGSAGQGATAGASFLLDPNQGAALALLAKLGDTLLTRYALATIALFGLLSLLSGAGVLTVGHSSAILGRIGLRR